MTSDIPSISGEAMARIDHFMIEDLGIDTLQLMELAGFGVAEVARRHCGLDLSLQPGIVALAGTGGNGGDAMVAARLLHAWGARLTVMLSTPRAGFSGIAAHQLAILDRMDVRVLEPDEQEIPAADLIIDGLLGFSLRGNPRGESSRLISLANAHPAPVLAIDLPSGLNATSGEVGDPCISATRTATLALPKSGLVSAPDRITGDIWIVDISIPPRVYGQIGVNVPSSLFADSSLVRYR